MDRRVSLLLTLVVALEFQITKPTFFVQAENPHPIIYVTNAESTLNETSNLVLKTYVVKKNFQDLSHDEFESINHLTKLIISNQTISESWLLEKDYLFASPTVKEFYLTDNDLPWLPSNAFARMPNLTFLSLAKNLLKDITFRSARQLEGLDLSTNSFTRFSHVFLNHLNALTRLRTLNLTDNDMSYVDDIKSKSLLSLDLSENTIYTIKKNELVNLPSLNTLIIARNKLKRIHPLAFANSSRLTVLDLSDNEKLGRLPIFETSPSGQKAYGLFSFDCANCGIKEIAPGTFNAMANLVKLNLARNNLETLPDRFFENLTSLQSLDLTNNSISWIPNGMFVGAESLNFLSLEGNPLKKLSLMPFLKTPRLSKLNVARCGLKHLWDTTNGVLKSLRYFFLAKNSIEKITRPELEVTPNLTHMDITENPFIAKKDFKEFSRWVQNMNVKLITTHEYKKGPRGAKHILKHQPDELQTSIEIPRGNYAKLISNQESSMTIESEESQTDEVKKNMLYPTMRALLIISMMIGLIGCIVMLTFCLLFIWKTCPPVEDTDSTKKQAKSPTHRRNVLKSEKCAGVKYAPLEENVV